MKFWIDDPQRGRIFFDIDEDRIWQSIKEKLEAEYVMTPREEQ
jgi:hypothetical protein